MATVYILFSQSINKFYIGSCLDFDVRYKQHLDKTFDKAFTTRAEDWIVFWKIDNINYKSARNIEKHIKKMKSKIYINNLIKYPEISYKLIELFS